MLLMECKSAFQFEKVFENAKFGQCGPHFCYEQIQCAEATVTCL